MRNEVGRQEKSAVGQDAPHERLGADWRARLEVEDRLVQHDELVLRERRLDVADDAGVDASVKEQRFIRRVPLRRVHLAVGPREQIVSGRSVVRKHGPADAGVDLDGGAVDRERLSERMSKSPDEGCSLFVVDGGQREDDELVAADARHGVARTHDSLEPPAERAKNGVSGAMAPDVVHVLEAVEVDRDEREGLLHPLGALERLVDPVLEENAVRQPCERVPQGLRSGLLESPVEQNATDRGAECEDGERTGGLTGMVPERDRCESPQKDERAQKQRPPERRSRTPSLPDFHPIPPPLRPFVPAVT